MAKQNKKLAEVFHFDLYGKRQNKYDFLNENSLNSIDWNKLENINPEFFFVKKNFNAEKKYKKGFEIIKLFKVFNNGIETGKDLFFYSYSEPELKEKINYSFANKTSIIEKYNITNTSSYKFKDKLFKATINLDKVRKVSYRPFDNIFNYYDEHLQRRPAFSTMKHMFFENLSLLVPRQVNDNFHHILISKYPTDCNLTGTAKKFGSAPIFPLYLYPDQEEGIFTEKDTSTSSAPSRKPNLNLEIVEQIAKKIGLEFVPEKPHHSSDDFKSSDELQFAPIDILDYIYAVLHSPTYREKYKEFLKIDFPRVPYPKDKDTFWKLVKLGGEIRQIHLLESPKVEEYITSYPIDGDNKITTKIGKKDWEITDEENRIGRIWINGTQYFDNIPLTAWEFYIGGYQPAQKWLKDRKERTLSFEDILHYQKIIVALSETDRLMKEIDKIEID